MRRYLGFALLASLAGCAPATDDYLTLSPRVLTIPAVQAAGLPAAQTAPLERTLLEYFGPWAKPTFRLPVLSESEAETELREQVPATTLARGQEVYLRNCALCHGVTGDGQGIAAEFLQPKPRDYRLGVFKFTSTPYGSKPRRADLLRTVRAGAKGTSMPAFRFLPSEDLEAVVAYVMMLSYRGEIENAVVAELAGYDAEEELDPVVIEDFAIDIAAAWTTAESQVVMPVSARPAFDDESIRRGQAAFLQEGAAGCAKCHGADARGHTQDNVGRDKWGHTVKAADLTAGMLHGGRRPIDVYRRIYSGINGTPMPAFGSALSDDPETIWHLVHFVLAVAEGRAPVGMDATSADTPSADTPSAEERSPEEEGADEAADGQAAGEGNDSQTAADETEGTSEEPAHGSE